MAKRKQFWDLFCAILCVKMWLENIQLLKSLSCQIFLQKMQFIQQSDMPE